MTNKCLFLGEFAALEQEGEALVEGTGAKKRGGGL